VKPTFLQNRFYKDTSYDDEIRKFCNEKEIIYQSFWSLTANPHILKSKDIGYLSMKYNMTPIQIYFSFLRSMNILPLTGTTSLEHMREDLDEHALNLCMETREINALKELINVS
jgi:diketogulonate reductase-like aldo/keto reductase